MEVEDKLNQRGSVHAVPDGDGPWTKQRLPPGSNLHVACMTDSTVVKSLLSWCIERGFWIDSRIQIISGPCGVAVISQDATIPADSIRELTIAVNEIMLNTRVHPSRSHPAGIGTLCEIKFHI